jgi:hypothetical protein
MCGTQLCSAPRLWGDRLPRHGRLESAGEASFTVDGVAMRPLGRAASGPAGCGDEFERVCLALGGALTPGMHTVAVTPLTDNYIDISHVIGI